MAEQFIKMKTADFDKLMKYRQCDAISYEDDKIKRFICKCGHYETSGWHYTCPSCGTNRIYRYYQ